MRHDGHLIFFRVGAMVMARVVIMYICSSCSYPPIAPSSIYGCSILLRLRFPPCCHDLLRQRSRVFLSQPFIHILLEFSPSPIAPLSLVSPYSSSPPFLDDGLCRILLSHSPFRITGRP